MSVVSSLAVRALDATAFAITVGDYELVEGVGIDAISEVWLARSASQPNRVLRLVRLKRDAVADAQSREAFLGFMRKVAARHSPLLLRVMAVGAEGDDVYAVVEHAEGVDFGSLLSVARDDGEPLPTGVVLRMLLDVIVALEALGTPHGDLTPSSIHLTAGGVTLLSPVSLAVAAYRAPRDGNLRRLAYKPPGLLAQEERVVVDKRADVFALGAILLEALTGHPLVRGTNGDDIAGAMAMALPPETDDLPVALAKVLLKALARDPAQRYADPTEMGQALEKAAPELIADRHQIASVFWHLAGNDLAARRFELESLLQGATEVAVEAARRSSEYPVAIAPAEAEAAVDEESAEAEQTDTEDTEPAEAEQADTEETESAEAEAEQAEAEAEREAEEEPARAKPGRERRGAGGRRPAVERDEPAVVRHRSVPPERVAKSRRVVTGIMIGAGALLLLGLVVRLGQHPADQTPAPDTKATHVSPPAIPAPPNPALTAKQTATAAPEAPPEEPPPAPQESAAVEPPAPAETTEPVETPPPTTHKKRVHHAKPPVAAKTAAPAPTASALPPVKHTASFGALPPANTETPKPPPAPAPSPAPAPRGIPGGI